MPSSGIYIVWADAVTCGSRDSKMVNITINKESVKLSL
jgi:hypothetical protein